MICSTMPSAFRVRLRNLSPATSTCHCRTARAVPLQNQPEKRCHCPPAHALAQTTPCCLRHPNLKQHSASTLQFRVFPRLPRPKARSHFNQKQSVVSKRDVQLIAAMIEGQSRHRQQFREQRNSLTTGFVRGCRLRNAARYGGTRFPQGTCVTLESLRVSERAAQIITHPAVTADTLSPKPRKLSPISVSRTGWVPRRPPQPKSPDWRGQGCLVCITWLYAGQLAGFCGRSPAGRASQ